MDTNPLHKKKFGVWVFTLSVNIEKPWEEVTNF
jgi:hypothetical protein